jgi:hypothetical protein
MILKVGGWSWDDLCSARILKSILLKLPRKVLYKINQDISVCILGGDECLNYLIPLEVFNSTVAIVS